MRKWLCLVICLTFLVCAAPLARAEEPDYLYSGDYCYYLLADGTACIAGYLGSDRSIVIPERLAGRTVTSMDEWAFYFFDSLEKVRFGKNITSIKPGAFSGCKKLEVIEAQDNPVYVTEDGILFDAAMDTLHTYPGGKRDTAYTIPRQVTVIGDMAFAYNETLAQVNIHGKVTGIGENAFYACTKLGGITIPANVKSIGGWAFAECAELLSVELSEGLLSIGNGAFYNCAKLMEATVPDSVKTIGEAVFHECASLKSVRLPKNLTELNGWMFFLCKKLTGVEIPKSVQTIGESAFYGCEGIKEVVLPERLTAIGPSAFYRCEGLAEVKIPSGVNEIGAGAFSACVRLAKIEVAPENKTYAHLEGVLFDKNNKKLHTYPGGRPAVRYNIPQGILSIEQEAFIWNDILTEITFPDSLVEIGADAFINCSAMTSYHVPAGSRSFLDLDGVLYTKKKDVLLLYPAKKEGAGFVVPAGTKVIGDGAFDSCYDLARVTLPHGLESIGRNAFSGCIWLTGIVVPEGVISIGDGAFDSCYLLKSIILPGSLRTMGEEAMQYCSELNDIVLPDGLESIGARALSKCDKLTSITIPESVTFIGEDAFLDSPKAVLSVVEGSYALKYAIENKLQYSLYVDWLQ